jgi:hypothetical protein
MTTTPNIETARLVREYAQWVIDECYDPDDDVAPLLLAITQTTHPSEATAVCHMGRALLCLHDSLSDPPYRLGGERCDERVMLLAARLGMLGTSESTP